VADLILIDLIPQEGFSATQRFGYQNIASATTQGVDSSLSARVLDPLTLQAGVQYLIARDTETGDDLPGRPPLSGNVSAILSPRNSGLSTSVTGAWNTSRPFYDDVDDDGVIDKVFAPPLLLLDARISYKVDRIELFVGAENLTDAGDAQYNQLKPRWFYAGMRGRFGADGP
jgi:outer membrane receptor protein involved in Fe transport